MVVPVRWEPPVVGANPLKCALTTTTNNSIIIIFMHKHTSILLRNFRASFALVQRVFARARLLACSRVRHTSIDWMHAYVPIAMYIGQRHRHSDYCSVIVSHCVCCTMHIYVATWFYLLLFFANNFCFPFCVFRLFFLSLVRLFAFCYYWRRRLYFRLNYKWNDTVVRTCAQNKKKRRSKNWFGSDECRRESVSENVRANKTKHLLMLTTLMIIKVILFRWLWREWCAIAKCEHPNTRHIRHTCGVANSRAVWLSRNANGIFFVVVVFNGVSHAVFDVCARFAFRRYLLRACHRTKRSPN